MSSAPENSNETLTSELTDCSIFLIIGGGFNGAGYEAATNPNMDSPEMYFTFGFLATVLAVYKWKRFVNLYEKE